MSGVKGRSGRRRLPVAHHLLTGGYRKDRHGPIPAATVPFPAPTSAPPVPPQLLHGLRAPGRELVEELWKAYAFSVATIPLLRLGAEAVDSRAAARVKGNERGELRAGRLLLDVLRQLQLER